MTVLLPLGVVLVLALAVASQLDAADASPTPWSPRASERGDVPAGAELRVEWGTQALTRRPVLTTVSLRLSEVVRLSIAYQYCSKSEPPMAMQHWADSRNALAAINGGYFQSTFLPTGLVRQDGREITPFSPRPLMSGCLVMDAQGHAALVRADDPLVKTAPEALQSGPFLIDPGGTIGIRTHPESPQAERSVIASSADGHMSLIATSSVTLADLSLAMHDHPDAFCLSDVERCLNLDGGPSTSLVIRGDRLQAGCAHDVLVPVMLEVLPRR